MAASDESAPRTNEHGLPIGRQVVGWTTRPRPAREPLVGAYVRLEPVEPRHAAALYAALGGPDAEPLWTYRPDEQPRDVEDLAARLRTWAASEVDVTYALVPTETALPAGLTSLLRIEPAQGSAEIGAVLYSPALQRTRAATEAVQLLASYLFEELGYRRLEWKLDCLNAASARAAQRLGFRYEGRFRNALVYKGRNRDTDWFAMTDEDWREVAPAYAAWLDPDNFDEDGHQRTALSDLTGRMD